MWINKGAAGVLARRNDWRRSPMQKNDTNDRAPANDREATVVGAAGVGLAVFCATMLAAYVGLDPKHLDWGLRESLSAFTLALPALATAGLFGIWARAPKPAWLFLSGGSMLVITGIYELLQHLYPTIANGIYELLQHLYPTIANGYAVMVGVCFVTMVAYAAWNNRTQRKENTKAATRAHQVAE
jgi:hypothetical protein